MPANKIKHERHPQRRLRHVLFGLMLSAVCGCQPVPSDPAAESFPRTTEESTSDPVPSSNAAAEATHGEASADASPAPRLPWESWYAYYLDDEHVGYNHLTAELISRDDQPLVRYRMDNQLTVRRGAAKLVQKTEQESMEQWSGHPIHLKASVRVGPDATQFRGRMGDGHFLIETIRGNETTSREIPWQPDFFGPHAVEQSLRDRPLEVGEQRTVQTLLPIQNTVGRADLRAVNREATELRNGTSRHLLKVENRLRIGENQEMTSYIWIDELGRTIKLAVPSLRLTGYRTSQAVATAAVDPQRDLVANGFVRLDRRIEEPKQLKEAFYRVTLSDNATLEILELPELPGQTVVRQSDGSLRISVRSGVHGRSAPPWDEPNADDLAAGPLVDFEAASVQSLAAQATAGERDDAKTTALRLTRFVHEHVTQKDFSRAFARASEVAEEAVGDCTEHAVLLAALLRDQQIPARIAAGLVYLDTADGPAMGYHMWNLAFVDDGWVALDAALGSGIAPANRITLLTSDLASGNEYDCLIPVLTALGQFQIEVITP